LIVLAGASVQLHISVEAIVVQSPKQNPGLDSLFGDGQAVVEIVSKDPLQGELDREKMTVSVATKANRMPAARRQRRLKCMCLRLDDVSDAANGVDESGSPSAFSFLRR
jgi:hypothetical protein